MKLSSIFYVLCCAAPLLATQLPVQATETTTKPSAAVAAAHLVQNAETEDMNHLQRDGVDIDFEIRPLGNDAMPTEGKLVDIRFRLRDATTGQPISGQVPGAWLDAAQSVPEGGDYQSQCKSRIGYYLKGRMGARPLIDFNSYYLLVLNQDASLTVIDPSISVGGITSTLSRIALKRAPMDWVASTDDKRLYVSMPNAGEVAVIDTNSFKVLTNIAAGPDPIRVALQPDQRYLWVGNDSRHAEQGGVTVIDTQSLERVKTLITGAGHHDITFSDDSRYAFVSNRDAGALTVFDVETLSQVAKINTGPHPLAVAFSPLSQAVYVSDGKDGTVTVVDARSLQVRKVIQIGRGIGPLRFSQNGRFGIVLNTMEDSATIIDAATDEVLHSVEVAAEPYQLVFTRSYAYIRGLASSKVSMISLLSLGEGKTPTVQSFEAGPAAPKLAGDLPIATSLAPAREDAAVFVVNPVDNSTYFYTEGMNAPMFSYLNRGHAARAAKVIDRSLREVEPGVYSTRVKLPPAGQFDVALMLNQPELTHCFSTEVALDPALVQQLQKPKVEFMWDKPLIAGSPAKIRVQLTQGRDSQPLSGVADLRLRYFLAPSSRPREVEVLEVGKGLYEAKIELESTGAYYLHLASTSLGLGFNDLPYTSLRTQAATLKTAQSR
ncbi:YncE family protein [Oceanisphaera sp. IT1-181]|uniref:YncE family protein n=1 Tax=Oceanisphaera sp. IT1-181 TaxID=3081199 RepID=UPI0029C9C42D|nr:cytochrome D1 domain-containing protein [Oceanisphaera sp. IT1-181]